MSESNDSEFRGGRYHAAAVDETSRWFMQSEPSPASHLPPQRLTIRGSRFEPGWLNAPGFDDFSEMRDSLGQMVSKVAHAARWEEEAQYAWAIIGLLIHQNHGDCVTLSWDDLSAMVGQRGMLHLEPMDGTNGEYVEISYEKFGGGDGENA